MKVLGMFPTIVCKDTKAAIEFAEKHFGFSISESRSAIISDHKGDQTSIMKNEGNIRFDIVKLDVEKPFFSTCVRVDDFDEALKKFIDNGWNISKGPMRIEEAKKALLTSDSGIVLFLIQYL